MRSLDAFAEAKLMALDSAGTRRCLVETWRDGAVTARRDGRTLISFCCNDYLNLTQHPAVKRAAAEAALAYGAGAAASRLVTGNHPLYARLEARLSAFKGTEAALVFGSGYLANIGIVPALAGPGDLILVDALAHSCLMAGTKLSGAVSHVFRHNDLDHLGALFAAERPRHRHCLVLTDRVFSMDGDLAPVPAMAALAAAHDAWLMTDDAHGTGLLPPLDPAQVPLQMGTLSKALGSYGGYLCCSKPVAELLTSRARAFIYTTGLPPASVAAALASLDIIASDPSLGTRPLANARLFAKLLDLPHPESQIVPIIVGSEAAALEAAAALAEAGFLVTAIRPPTVPPGTARLRVTFTAGHSVAQVTALADAVRTILGR